MEIQAVFERRSLFLCQDVTNFFAGRLKADTQSCEEIHDCKQTRKSHEKYPFDLNSNGSFKLLRREHFIQFIL